jgi:adenylate cyclase
MTAGLQERERIRETFGTYVDRDVAEHILREGTSLAGNVGGAGRLEFSVIGDAINVAARVESATRQTGDTILVSDDTRRLLRDGELELEARPAVPLKGKSETVALFAPPPTTTTRARSVMNP